MLLTMDKVIENLEVDKDEAIRNTLRYTNYSTYQIAELFEVSESKVEELMEDL